MNISGIPSVKQRARFDHDQYIQDLLDLGDWELEDLGLPAHWQPKAEPQLHDYERGAETCGVRQLGLRIEREMQVEIWNDLAEREANRILHEAGHEDMVMDPDEQLLDLELEELQERWLKVVDEAATSAVPDPTRWENTADEREGAIEAAWQRVHGEASGGTEEDDLATDLWAGRQDRADKHDHLIRPPVDVSVRYRQTSRKPAKPTFRVEQADYRFEVTDPREVKARNRTRTSQHVEVDIGGTFVAADKKQQRGPRFELRRDDLLAIRQACHRLDGQGRKTMAKLLIYSVRKAGLRRRVAGFAASHPAAVFSLVAEALGSDALSTGNKPDWSQLNAFRTAVGEELVAMNHRIATYTIDEIVEIVTSGEMSWLSAIKALAAEADCRLTLCQKPENANARFNKFQSIKNARDEKKRAGASKAGGRKLKRIPRKQKTSKGRPGRDRRDSEQPRARS